MRAQKMEIHLKRDFVRVLRLHLIAYDRLCNAMAEFNYTPAALHSDYLHELEKIKGALTEEGIIWAGMIDKNNNCFTLTQWLKTLEIVQGAIEYDEDIIARIE